MTLEQLEEGIALKTQIDELSDFINRFGKYGFDTNAWVPDNLKGEHNVSINAFTLEYIGVLNRKLGLLMKQFNEL